MAAGDYVIRRNSSNTDVIPATASGDLLLDWPTAVANVGSGITHSAGTFTLGEIGHFLVMCSEHTHSVDNTNNERIGYSMAFTLAGTELVEGYSNAFIRKNNTALLDYITFGATVIEVTTTTGNGDELEVRLQRADDVILTGPVRVVDDRSGITIIKLDDAWGYGRYQSSAVTATSATDNTRTVMNIQTQDEQDSPFTRTTNDVDIASTNLILAVYSVKSQDAGSAGRSEFQSNLFLGGTALEGSWNQQYSRNSQDGGWAGSSNVVLFKPGSSGLDINVGVVSREGGGEDFEAALQLIELPTSTEAIIVESAAGNYNVIATNFNWPNAPAYEDTAAFTFSAGQTNIDVDNDDDYIVIAAQCDATDIGSSATRAMPALQFRVNTTDVETAGSTTYNRNNNTADHSGLACATLLPNLSINDSIHCRNDKLGANSATITNTDGAFAVIRLSSLFPAGGGELSIPVAMNSYRQRHQFSIG